MPLDSRPLRPLMIYPRRRAIVSASSASRTETDSETAFTGRSRLDQILSERPIDTGIRDDLGKPSRSRNTHGLLVNVDSAGPGLRFVRIDPRRQHHYRTHLGWSVDAGH
jgi:hypothetical protein